MKKKETPKFEYCIEHTTNIKTFENQCKALEESLIYLIKSGGGSPMQFYSYQDKEITVMYDMDT